MRGTSVSLALIGLGAVSGLPTRTNVEERSPQIVGPPTTTLTPGNPEQPPKDCAPEWLKFGICIPTIIQGPIIPNPPKDKRQTFSLPPDGDKAAYIQALKDQLKVLELKKDKSQQDLLDIISIKTALAYLGGGGGVTIGKRDDFVIGKPVVGPIVPGQPKPSKPWKWWPWAPKDGKDWWTIGPPKVGPITPETPVPGGPLVPAKPVEGGEIKPAGKRDTDPILIIGPPTVGPIVPAKPGKGAPLKPGKRDIFIIGPPKVGPIVPAKPGKGAPLKPGKRDDFIIGPPKVGPIVPGRPVTPRPVTPRPVTPRPVTPRPVDPRPVDPRPVTPRPVTPLKERDTDPILIIGPPTVGPIVPAKPEKGAPLKPGKRDSFIIGTPKVGPIVPDRPVTPRPVTPRPVTPRPVTPRPVTPRPVTPRPVPDPVFIIGPPKVGPIKPGKRDDIIVIGKPSTGPLVPAVPIPGAPIKPAK